MSQAGRPVFPSYTKMSDISGVTEKGISKFELTAIESHAQLARCVQREGMTSEEAAKLSIKHAEALMKEFDDWSS